VEGRGCRIARRPANPYGDWPIRNVCTSSVCQPRDPKSIGTLRPFARAGKLVRSKVTQTSVALARAWMQFSAPAFPSARTMLPPSPFSIFALFFIKDIFLQSDIDLDRATKGGLRLRRPLLGLRLAMRCDRCAQWLQYRRCEPAPH